MKILVSRESMATIALLMLLSLSAVAGMTFLVNAAAVKEPTVYVNGRGFVELTWKSGKSETYSSNAYPNLGGLDALTIIPSHGWHIAAVLIDGISQEILDDDEFRLINVRVKSMVSVTFLPNNGVDDVETGEDVEAYPYSDVGLRFALVEGEGWATADTIEWAQYPDQVGESWDIQTTAYFVNDVQVILVLNLTEVIKLGLDPTALRLWRTEVGLARADVNLDGEVDGTDVSIVANANPSNWDPRLDQNNDGVINDEDVNKVNNYIGESVWEDITLYVVVDYDNDLVYVYGVTDHFSIFGIHK